MRVEIQDKEALLAISPLALSAYARSLGWEECGVYRKYGDIYVAKNRPEIMIPNIQELDDYATVVATLIRIFAEVAGADEISLYHDLITYDRDVIRVRVSNEDSGSVSMREGIDLVQGARELLLAAACSLDEPMPYYSAAAKIRANKHLKGFHLGQTEHGSFVIRVLTPVVKPSSIQQQLVPNMNGDETDYDNEHLMNIERKVTRRLMSALSSTRNMTETEQIRSDKGSLNSAIESGINADLCRAIVKLIGPFLAIDISSNWARNYIPEKPRDIVEFRKPHVQFLSKYAEYFDAQELENQRERICLKGVVERLHRKENEVDGMIDLRAYVDPQERQVSAELSPPDYERAIQAHKGRSYIALEGELDKSSKSKWKLINAKVVEEF